MAYSNRKSHRATPGVRPAYPREERIAALAYTEAYVEAKRKAREHNMKLTREGIRQ